MFVLEWTAYPWISLAVGIPLALLYAVERRREVKADRAYDAVTRPCMAHVDSDPDGMGYWCWKVAGHTGDHQWIITDLRDDDPDADSDGELIGFTPPWRPKGSVACGVFDGNGVCEAEAGHDSPHRYVRF